MPINIKHIIIGVVLIGTLLALLSGLYVSNPYSSIDNPSPKPQLVINGYEIYLFTKYNTQNQECSNELSSSSYRGFPASYINIIGIGNCKNIVSISTAGLAFNFVFYASLVAFVIYAVESSQRRY